VANLLRQHLYDLDSRSDDGDDLLAAPLAADGT
jgi:hypothetical protein